MWEARRVQGVWRGSSPQFWLHSKGSMSVRIWQGLRHDDTDQGKLRNVQILFCLQMRPLWV